MSEKKRIILLVCSLLLVLSAAVGIAIGNDASPGSGIVAVKKVEHAVGKRMLLLQLFSRQVLEGKSDEWPQTLTVPEDMVIYRYCNDTLQSWINQFPLSNDDIRPRMLAPRIINTRLQPDSPLADVGSEPGFFNFGPKWYLAAAITKGNVKVIYGLELVNTQDSRSYNGVNPVFHLSDKYSIRPLSHSEGYEIKVNNKPAFKIICERVSSDEKGAFLLFSPVLYADAPFFPSLGAILLINFLLTVICLFLFSIRKKKNVRLLLFAFSAAIVAYSFLSIRSIILNSNISLELYKYGELSIYSILVYASYVILFLGIPILLRLNVKSRVVRIVFSSSLAVFFVLISSILGKTKEEAKVEVWADRLSVNRDIPLELQLRQVEDDISEDMLISTLSRIKSSSATIRSRLIETCLRRTAQTHDISVYTMFDAPPHLEGGEPIAEGSHFVYSDTPGTPSYSGMFLYGNGSSISSVLIVIERRDDKTSRGYSKIFGLTPPGKVTIPSQYSYAHYKDGHIAACKGNYPYSTTMNHSRTGSFDYAGYVHFSNQLTDSELVIISRPKINAFNYITELLFLFMVAFVSITVLSIRQRPRRALTNSYRRRITTLIMGSLVITLVAMATVSVVFVVSRNDSNLKSVMSDKIATIQNTIEGTLRSENFDGDFRNPTFIRLLERVAGSANTDITLFNTNGRILVTTNPYVYESMLLGGKLNGEAYRKIVFEGRRYFLNTESAGELKYQNMYAPLLDADGNLIAILCSPYTRESYDFEEDALNHSMMIISVFLILMLISRMLTKTVLDKMLNPLNEMGAKMRSAGVDSLEHIEYDNVDEISTLVQSYNRMVSDLSESTARLAQAERDKAWSGMARQVAHEIKNPLTPMKLQIQRIIRLKEKNDPSWVEKFDEMSKVLLDHIDILTDTANQFSTFAKLYSEEATDINLDNMLKEELTMFDNSSSVSFEYRGLEGAVISGPKPQLVRVIVNLLGNAVQAIDGNGTVLVSLRNSTVDGYYDIVVEDDGQGVSEENIDKLFTPNFTTKNGGSGLGLAISRSILEKCGASINYSRSFSLGGACFTIRYPKPQKTAL